MVMTKKPREPSEIMIEKLRTGRADVWLRGRTPFICAAMSAKAKRELLYPRGRRTGAARAQSLKHSPLDEYRESMYLADDGGPTRILVPATAFKGAMCSAALETPGATKAQIGRLVWVENDMLPIYGVPQIGMWGVRTADMRHTPDVRTHAILPRWACMVQVCFAEPTINLVTITRLLGIAGLLIGVGDFRQEKGKGSYGQFEVVERADVADIIKDGGCDAQDAAITAPAAYNAETRKLYEWFVGEHTRRTGVSE